jgi:hypothetical protein
MDQHQSLLFKLPPELRNMVYTYTLLENDLEKLPSGFTTKRFYSPALFQWRVTLLTLCRRVYYEARGMATHLSTLCIRDAGCLVRVQNMRPGDFESLPHLLVVFRPLTTCDLFQLERHPATHLNDWLLYGFGVWRSTLSLKYITIRFAGRLSLLDTTEFYLSILKVLLPFLKIIDALALEILMPTYGSGRDISAVFGQINTIGDKLSRHYGLQRSSRIRTNPTLEDSRTWIIVWHKEGIRLDSPGGFHYKVPGFLQCDPDKLRYDLGSERDITQLEL